MGDAYRCLMLGAGGMGSRWIRDMLVERDGGGPAGSYRANFVRDADDRVAWLSYGGRLYGRQR